MREDLFLQEDDVALKYFESETTGVVFVVLENGDDLLASIRAVAKQVDIHTVISSKLPPEEAYLSLPGPLEEGCQVLTLIEFSILRTRDVRLERKKAEGKLLPMLDRE